MTELEDVVNIGTVLADQLRQVGIADFDQLVGVGAFEATRRLEAAGKHDCTNAYLALEGAVAGLRWTLLPKQRRAELTQRWRNR
jgi:DNA transformation protein and related proteins